MDPHFAFHYANSWESKNALGQDVVTMWALVHKHIDIGMMNEHFTKEDANPLEITKFEFNMVTGEIITKKPFEILCEFPVINQEYIGRKNRYFYFCASDLTSSVK